MGLKIDLAPAGAVMWLCFMAIHGITENVATSIGLRNK